MFRESPFFCTAYMSPCVETSNSEATILCNYQNIQNAWCILGVISASHALDIIWILKTMSVYEGTLLSAIQNNALPN